MRRRTLLTPTGPTAINIEKVAGTEYHESQSVPSTPDYIGGTDYLSEFAFRWSFFPASYRGDFYISIPEEGKNFYPNSAGEVTTGTYRFAGGYVKVTANANGTGSFYNRYFRQYGSDTAQNRDVYIVCAENPTIKKLII